MATPVESDSPDLLQQLKSETEPAYRQMLFAIQTVMLKDLDRNAKEFEKNLLSSDEQVEKAMMNQFSAVCQPFFDHMCKSLHSTLKEHVQQLRRSTTSSATAAAEGSSPTFLAMPDEIDGPQSFIPPSVGSKALQAVNTSVPASPCSTALDAEDDHNQSMSPQPSECSSAAFSTEASSSKGLSQCASLVSSSPEGSVEVDSTSTPSTPCSTAFDADCRNQTMPPQPSECSSAVFSAEAAADMPSAAPMPTSGVNTVEDNVEEAVAVRMSELGKYNRRMRRYNSAVQLAEEAIAASSPQAWALCQTAKRCQKALRQGHSMPRTANHRPATCPTCCGPLCSRAGVLEELIVEEQECSMGAGDAALRMTRSVPTGMARMEGAGECEGEILKMRKIWLLPSRLPSAPDSGAEQAPSRDKMEKKRVSERRRVLQNRLKDCGF